MIIAAIVCAVLFFWIWELNDKVDESNRRHKTLLRDLGLIEGMDAHWVDREEGILRKIVENTRNVDEALVKYAAEHGYTWKTELKETSTKTTPAHWEKVSVSKKKAKKEAKKLIKKLQSKGKK